MTKFQSIDVRLYLFWEVFGHTKFWPTCPPIFCLGPHFSDLFAFSSQEIERWSSSLSLQSQQIDAQLADQLKHRDNVRAAQHQVFDEYLPAYLVPLIGDALRLEKSLDEASVVAETVSRRVREVDVIRKRAVEALQQATDAIALKECVEGVDSALRNARYEEAVQHMAIYLRFNTKMAVDAETRATMASAETQLLAALRNQLNQAIDSNSIADMTRLAKLFAPLGLYDEGVAHYASYLEKQINTDLQAIIAQAKESAKAAAEKGSGEKASYAAAVSQLVQRAHQRLKRAKPVLEQAFGASGLLHAMLILQPVLSSHICTLIDDLLREWNHFRHQSDMISKAATARQNESSLLSLASYGPSSTTALPPWNPLEFSPVLDQLVIICQTIEVHARFVNAVVAQASTALQKLHPQSAPSSLVSSRSSNPTTPTTPRANFTSENLQPSADDDYEKTKAKIETFTAKLNNAIQLGPLNERLVELMGYYLKFEQYYLNRSIETVLAHDAAEDGRNGSIVDDVFFLLKEASNRARATYNANALCAVTNYIVSELNAGYWALLESRSSREALQNARSSTLSSSSSQPSAHNVLIAINQVEQTGTYIGRLKTDVEEPSKKVFAAQAHDLEKVLLCCEELTQAESRFKELVVAQLGQIVDAMKPRFQALFDVISGVNYKLTPTEYSEYQINDPFAGQLILGLKEVLSPIEDVLTPTTAATLGALTTRLFVRFMERSIVKKPFTQLGAQQMDTDVQKICDFFTEHSPKGFARECFQRLLQIAFLLNFDSLSEVQEEWNTRIANRLENDPRPAWTLSSTDLKRVLSLRVDFPKDKVDTLAVRDSGFR